MIQITICDLLGSSESLSDNIKHIFERSRGVRRGGPLKTFGPSRVLWKGVAQQPLFFGSNAEGDKEHSYKASMSDTVSHQELATNNACVFDIGERLFGSSSKNVTQSVWYVGALQHAEDQRVVNTGKGTNEISEQNAAIVG